MAEIQGIELERFYRRVLYAGALMAMEKTWKTRTWLLDEQLWLDELFAWSEGPIEYVYYRQSATSEGLSTVH